MNKENEYVPEYVKRARRKHYDRPETPCPKCGATYTRDGTLGAVLEINEEDRYCSRCFKRWRKTNEERFMCHHCGKVS
jgi:predicted RNA-binding Zn-ribbon protein involved in translation (DUF1610 family)